MGINCLNALGTEIVEKPTDQIITETFIDETPNFYAVDELMRKIIIKKMLLRIHFVIEEDIILFNFRNYYDASTGNQLYDLATANLKSHRQNSTILITKDGSDKITVSWLPAEI
jgi:hypothetical protein